MKLTLLSNVCKRAFLLILFAAFNLIATLQAQVEIASQRFHNGDPSYQYTVADKDGIWAPASQTITTHVGTDNWDYTATTSNGIIRVVNSDITAPASDLYCLELKNYWDDDPTVEFAEIDITNYTNVSFSIAYQSLGDPELLEDLILEYSYFDGGAWVDTTVTLVEGKNATNVLGINVEPDIRLFNVSFPDPNPFVVNIPDTATAFKATVSSTFLNGNNGNDNYYIDDVILQGNPTTTAPIAVCKNDFSIELDAFGNASITPADIDNGSTVFVGTMSLSINKSDFTCADLGSNLITLTVDDGTQTATCTTTVTVNNYSGSLIAPTIDDVTATCSYTASTPADISYQCNIVTPTTTDPVTFDSPGNYSITWTYYDSVSGNSDTAIQNITVSALAAPTGISVSNIGADTATITWDAQAGVDSYIIQYKKNVLINWETVTSTTNSVVLTGLDQLTLYGFQISAKCNGTSSTFSTLDTFTTTGHDYCVPSVENNSTNYYVRNVRVGTINNTTTRTSGGYGDYSNQSTILYKNESHTFGLTFRNGTIYSSSRRNLGHTVWIDFNGDGDFEDAGELVWNNNGNLSNAGQDQTFNPSIFIPSYVVTGQTRMRVAVRQDWYPDDPCSDDTWDGKPGEFEDYTLNLQIRPDSPQEIDVTGNGNLIVDEAGTAELSIENNTDFGNYDIYEAPMVKTYKITNNGADPLTLTGTPLVQFVSNTGDFTLTQPAISYLEIGESTTFTITFNPNSVGTKSAVIRILNDDIDSGDTEEDYTFLVQGIGVKTFPDTDGDGVPDNIDGDDDNDGILDTEEDLICKSYNYSTQVEVVFLNETFGSGYDRVQIDEENEGATTSYCFENGTGSATCADGWQSNDLNDGEYTIYYRAGNGDGTNQTPDGEVAQWADSIWYTGFDHTPDNIDGAEPGRMLLINASYDPGVFYNATISGVTPGVEVTYGFSVINLDRTDAQNIETRKRPEVLIAVYDANGNALIPTTTSGLIQPTDPSNPDGDWVTVETTFTTNSSQFTVQLINSQDGGLGNDLAIDDIYVKQILCDLDGDGVADSIDLDNDNDGIPNVIELGLADGDKDSTLLGDGWVDANGNGVHDSYEGGVTLIDTDNDGIPDYIDSDSDNDGIFDAVEYDGFGDIDINGDGLGDGSDSDSGINNDDADGDGILTIMDNNDDDTDTISDTDHGTLSYPDPMDNDGDGIPNYLDLDSDNDGVYDIHTTIYADHDANNDGVVDGTTDADQDGIMDSFDTDNTTYGSPRDLNDSYTLYFDGRNDYVEEGTVINAWSDATIMSWVKIDAASKGERRIVGQNGLYLTLNTDSSVSAVANGITINNGTALPTEIWVHVAASFNSTSRTFTLYVNGNEVASESTSGTLPSDTSSFTIGRTPDVDNNYFQGEIDEVRLFNVGLSEDDIQKMVYQELDDANGFNQGAIIPLEINPSLGSSLVRYFKMDGYKDDILDDKRTPAIDEGTGAKIYNIKNIYPQTAPLPYQTKADGDWSTTATWLHGNVWDITDEATNKDWSIVHVKNNVTTSNSHGTLGLIVNAAVELEVNKDVELKNTWYLNLDGFIDLQGESQLVQTSSSTLVAGSNGYIERDQQGTENLYTYNYWSSPVHTVNPNGLVDGDESYTLTNVLYDGTDALNPQPIIFIGGYNGSNTTSPIQLANYWIWKFDNHPDGDYSSWQHVTSTGTLKVGEGYTMKGPGTGPISNEQNYVFTGTPNNGEVLLTTNAGNNYLVGNPYPSAIDGAEFLMDNPHLNGTLYFWEHYGGGSHILQEYQGGYGLYNFSGGVPALSGTHAAPDASVDSSGMPTKTPRRYIPVGQGFFVVASTTGDTKFENDQRIFVKEEDNTNSWFIRSSNAARNNAQNIQDDRPKFRFGYKSPNGYGRQLLLTIDENATEAVDWGFEGALIEDNVEDMSWQISDSNYIIQALGQVNDATVLPLTVKTQSGGIIEIEIDALENVADDVQVFLRDNGTYHDLRTSKYIATVDAGIISNRFEIVFAPQQTLSDAEFELQEQLTTFYNSSASSIVISNQNNHTVKTLQVINMVGQKVFATDINSNQREIVIPVSMQSGAYIFTINTDTASISKKAIIN